MKRFDRINRRTLVLRRFVILLLLVTSVPPLRGQSVTNFDEYKVRIDGFWFYSNPTGNIISLHKDFEFGSYSTFAGKLDWKFTRKNHLYLVGSAFDQSRQTLDVNAPISNRCASRLQTS